MAKKVVLSVEKALELLNGEVDKFNEAIKTGGEAYDDGIKTAMVEVKSAYIKDAIAKYSEGREDVIMDYVMGDRFTTIPSVSYDKETGMGEVVAADAINAPSVVIPLDGINSASGNAIPNITSIRLLCRIFSENLYTACCKSADGGNSFSKEAMNADMLEVRRSVAKKVGSYWDATSMTAVQKQMAHLFKLYLGTKAPADCRAALKYLEWALISSPKARKRSEMGKTKFEDNAKVVEWYIMDAMRVLLAGETFHCANKPTDVSKATQKAVGKMDTLPKEYTETAKGGRVRTGNSAARRKDKETQGKQEEPVKAEETKEETAA